jgi:hypothetical protein
VLSARLSLELSECKGYSNLVRWFLSESRCTRCVGSLGGLSGSLAIVFNPQTWCGVARTLCAGGVETSFLGGEAP